MNPACLSDLLSGGHHIVCQALRRLATLKAPQHEKSIMKILLFTLFQRQKERGKLVCTTGAKLKDAAGVPEGADEVAPDAAVSHGAATGTATPFAGETGPETGASTSQDLAAHAPRPLPAGHPLLTVSAPSSIRSISPNTTTSPAYDKAMLQQQIHQKLRMYNSTTPGASSDSEDEDFTSMADPHAPTKSHLSPFPSTTPTARSLSPRLAEPSQQQEQHHESGNVPLSWAEVEALQSHFSDWPAEDTRDWRKTKNFVVKLMLECGLFDDEDAMKRDPVSGNAVRSSTGDESSPPPEKRRPSPQNGKRGGGGGGGGRNDFDPTEFVLHLISKIESNGFGLWSPKTVKCLGRAIFPRASYFNHSCDPNCECVQTGRTMTIRTKRPVEDNEDLTISYIDTNLPLHARRQRLQEEYFFLCECRRCSAEAASGGGVGTGKVGKVSYERSFAKERKRERTGSRGGTGSGSGGEQQQQQAEVRVVVEAVEGGVVGDEGVVGGGGLEDGSGGLGGVGLERSESNGGGAANGNANLAVRAGSFREDNEVHAVIGGSGGRSTSGERERERVRKGSGRGGRHGSPGLGDGPSRGGGGGGGARGGYGHVNGLGGAGYGVGAPHPSSLDGSIAVDPTYDGYVSLSGPTGLGFIESPYPASSPHAPQLAGPPGSPWYAIDPHAPQQKPFRRYSPAPMSVEAMYGPGVSVEAFAGAGGGAPSVRGKGKKGRGGRKRGGKGPGGLDRSGSGIGSLGREGDGGGDVGI
ncbi:hypothetical protein HDV00_006222 [Rhizophlyctis rosea]|nr:hypothetical protein HDV00_006222 [Rhizophlyctis rosea]